MTLIRSLLLFASLLENNSASLILLLFASVINSLIISLNLPLDLLHLLGLLLPFLLAHFRLPSEELRVWRTVATAHSIPQRRVLSVVIVEVQMMHGMAGGAVQDGAVGDVFSVVDDDGPDLHEGEEAEVCELLQREDERENVVWYRLQPAVHRVEGNGRVWGWHDPLVMWLVEILIDQGMMQKSMDPVDGEIGEEEEEREYQVIVVWVRLVRKGIIELRVASNFCKEEWSGEDRDPRHCADGLCYLLADLILQELGMLVGCFVEDEDVR